MKAGDLRAILHYVPQFRDKSFVLAVDGSVVNSPAFSHLFQDIAVLRSLNIGIILCHGAAAQIAALAAARDIAISSADGTGITDDATLALSVEAVTTLTRDCQRGSARANLSAVMAHVHSAHPTGIIDGIDQQHTGKIDRTDTAALCKLVDDGFLPILSPIVYDGLGEPLRVNSDELAMHTAIALGAAKLIYLTCHTLPDDLGTELRQLPAAAAADLATHLAAEKKPELRGLTAKLKYAVRACEAGIPRVHLLDARLEDALLRELFSNEGVGTMIFADEYQQIRAARLEDIPTLLGIMHNSVLDHELLQRDTEDITTKIGDYWVVETDGNLIGMVAVHSFGSCAELACLFVKRSQKAQGYGQMLGRFAEQQAKKLGCEEIFALTTQATTYFTNRLGFTVVDDYPLPPQRAELLKKNKRGSKIMLKKL